MTRLKAWFKRLRAALARWQERRERARAVERWDGERCWMCRARKDAHVGRMGETCPDGSGGFVGQHIRRRPGAEIERALAAHPVRGACL